MAEESTSIYLIQSVVSSPVNSEPCQLKYSYEISPFTISPVLERKAGGPSYVKIATRFIKACCNFKADLVKESSICLLLLQLHCTGLRQYMNLAACEYFCVKDLKV